MGDGRSRDDETPTPPPVSYTHLDVYKRQALTVLACVQATKGAGGTGSVAPKQLAMYLFGACACTAVGAVVIRIIMYAVGTSVEQFIYH